MQQIWIFLTNLSLTFLYQQRQNIIGNSFVNCFLSYLILLDLVLDCPSLAYLDSMHKSELNSHSYHVIIHLASNSILNNETYRSWMKRLIG